MSSQYAGDGSTYPVDYTIPDDSDPPTAAAVNVGLEALGDRTAWLKANGVLPGAPVDYTVAGDTAITAPATATHVFIDGYAGGAGAGSGLGNQSADTPTSGGGGGAGSRRMQKFLPVTGGGSYIVTVGSGGNGGAAPANGGVAGNNGSAGTASKFKTGGGTVLFEMTAPLAGLKGTVSSGLTSFNFGIGGSPCGTTQLAAKEGPQEDNHRTEGIQGHGGAGITGNCTMGHQGSSNEGHTGGFYGTPNSTSSGSFRGGGAGGGGGAGPGGDGGNGGSGGAPSNASAISAPTAGQSAAANSGAGGGGGGSSGNTAGASPGGAGGNGGSGKVTLIWFTKGL